MKALGKSYSSTINISAFRDGMRDAIPIGLGYFAVSFSLGIAARNAGLIAFQGFLASALVNASAGEYAGFLVIAANAPYLEMIFVTLIANIRYSLMSFAMSQKMKADTPLIHRLIMGNYITDEIFAISIARPGYLNPAYTYGAVVVASPCWAVGTALGIIIGNLLPIRVVSALSVALYGMFLAVIIPPARKNIVTACIIFICFTASCASSVLPWISSLSDGSRVIILTVVISSLAAAFFPIKQEDDSV